MQDRDNTATCGEQVNADPEGVLTLFRFNNVPVNARRSFCPMPFLLWGFLAGLAAKRRPERPLTSDLIVGAVGMVVALGADIGHALGHTVSARYADAPMSEVSLGFDMPRTLYQNDAVPPQAHQLRAIGGPIFSAVGLMLSLLWRRASVPRSLSRELADVSSITHGFIFLGSLLPLPIVDGGTILKWALVRRGCAPDEADQTVKTAGLTSVISLVVLVTVLMARHRRSAQRQR